MPTANEVYRDEALRHQVGLRRYGGTLANKVGLLLQRADRELAAELRKALALVGDDPRQLNFTGRRWMAMRRDIETLRAGIVSDVQERVTGELKELSVVEAQLESKLIRRAVPVEINLTMPHPAKLEAAVTTRPFGGRLLQDWFESLQQSDRRRIIDSLQLGVTLGETTNQIVGRVIGTRGNGYADGAVARTRGEAEAIVRTGVAAISTTARESVWNDNSDLIAALVWVSTLDGRTTLICASNDGKAIPIGGKPLPEELQPVEPAGLRVPAHVGCRSVEVAYLDGIGIVGHRPTVRDTRTRKEREADFRRQAKEEGRSVKEIRQEWADANIGRVPARQTYQEWLAGQPAGFQDDVLGPGRAALFRSGELKLDQFVDHAGKPVTLKDLRAQVDETPPAQQLRIEVASAAQVPPSPSSLPAEPESLRQLRELPVVGSKPLGGGVNGSHLVKLEDGSEAVWKPASGEAQTGEWGDLYRRESAIYQLDRMLGVNMVPETTVRRIGDEVGSIQRFAANSVKSYEVLPSALRQLEETEGSKLLMLDVVSANGDRHSANVLFKKITRDKYEFVAIDNGFAMPETQVDLKFFSFVGRGRKREQLEKLADFSAHAEAIRAVDLTAVAEMLQREGIGRDAALGVVGRIAALQKDPLSYRKALDAEGSAGPEAKLQDWITGKWRDAFGSAPSPADAVIEKVYGGEL